MAHGDHQLHDRDAMLRRVAIVLSSLPAAVADDLIGSFDPRSKQAVRQAISTLTDVDPLERRRALHAFKVSFQQQSVSRAVPTTSDRQRSPAGPAAQPAVRASAELAAGETAAEDGSDETQTSPMSFLRTVDDRLLLRLLGGEHPQTIAVVLASIPPNQAARILPQLDARTQTETLSRIGRLAEVPESVVDDVAEHFRSRVEQHRQNERDSSGQQALDAILAAMPGRVSGLHRSEDMRNDSIDRADSVADADPIATRPQQADDDPVIQSAPPFPTADQSIQQLTDRLRIAAGTYPDAPPQPTGPPTSPLQSTDSIAVHLEQLTPAELCQALGKVETRIAMLALCGLPNPIAEAALATLPRGEARKVRSAMNSIGSLNLREIDNAKEAVARASIESTQRVPVAA